MDQWQRPRAVPPITGPGWQQVPTPASPVIGQGVVVRQYPGKLAAATIAFQVDAASMAAAGYYPVSQIYQPGSWGCGAFLVAVALILAVGLGLLILAYMVIVKPAGVLVVTYQWQAPASPAPAT